MSSIANLPVSVSSLAPKSVVRVAEPQFQISTLDNSSEFVSVTSSIIFDDISAVELANIVRADQVNGIHVDYEPIPGIGRIRQDYNSVRMSGLFGRSDEIFKAFPINLGNKIPDYADTNVYIDPDTGDLIIDLVNLATDEIVEVQILKSGELFDDTIL